MHQVGGKNTLIFMRMNEARGKWELVRCWWRSWYVHLVACRAGPQTLLWGEGVDVPGV